jgi:PAS domain S-box-containing protein
MPLSMLESTPLDDVLEHVNVPSYVIDTSGVIRWVNSAGQNLVGDVRGRQFTSVVAPEETLCARELFARKVLGTTSATEATAVLVSTDGERLVLDVSAVPLRDGERIVGVFGLLSGRRDEEPSTPPAHLTPRQAEVLRLLEQGCSNRQIAQELDLSTETVKNHVRNLMRALGVKSRLEAVAAVRR